MGAPSTHSMSGLSLARHVHGVVGHVRWSSHCGIVLSLWSRVLVACIYKGIESCIFT